MARSEAKIQEGAAPFVEDGEEVLAAIVARPRGSLQASGVAGSGAARTISAALGQKKLAQNVAAAEDAGFELPNPVGLAVTSQRLLALDVTAPVGLGIGMKVKGLTSTVPVTEVDSIEVKRLAVGTTVTVTVRGVPFVLEVGPGANTKGVVAALEQAKGGAVASAPSV